MKIKIRLQVILPLFLVMALTLSVAQPGLAASTSSKSFDEGIVYDPMTGAMAFWGVEPGQAAPERLTASSASPSENAEAFLRPHTGRLGLSSLGELALTKTRSESNGRASVRYKQTYQGVPVFGGEVIVNTNAEGAMLSVTAKTSPNLQLDVNPTLTASDANASAITAVAKYNHLDVASLTAGAPVLQIYDSRLLNPDGVPPRLVWNTIVSSLDGGVREVVLVDAHSGAIALRYSQTEMIDSVPGGEAVDQASNSPAAESGAPAEILGVPQIGIYNLHHTAPPPDSPSLPGQFICDQNNRTNCDGVGADDVDATNAYLNALDAYNFMKNHLGIDSIDNAGTAIKGSIHYGNNYNKVSWITIVHTAAYGSGYSGADDMAGRAIGFGLLEYSDASTVILAYQPGAIVESFVDMWGEFIDQTNGRGNDSSTVKWVIGESWPGGAQRNMRDPTLAPFRDPDKMSSQYYYLGDDNSIGIYKNAGVNNKAVSLMTSGGSFNGRTIAAMGVTKVARIYYEVEKHLLASASTYFDLYYAVKQACYNLIGTVGINAKDCDNVRSALDAVQMNLTKSAALFPVAQFCPAGKSRGDPNDIFFDSLEVNTSKWALYNSVPGATEQWTRVEEEATDGLFHFEGPESTDTSLPIAQMVNSVFIPGGAPVYLFFEHWFDLEAIGSNFHDGGVLHYSTNNGATWNHTAGLYATGQNYNGTLQSGPLAGQPAFGAYVRNYVSTTFNLTSLAGQSVKFRFLVSSDDDVSGAGWFVDNIQIYRCVAIPTVPKLVGPATKSLQKTFTPTLDWSDSTPTVDVDYYLLEVSTNDKFTSLVYQASSPTSNHTLTQPLTPNKTYYWRVRAYNASNDANGWSAMRSFRTSLGVPVLITPINGITVGGLRPNFDWNSISGASSYTIQISGTPTFSSLTINTTIKGSAFKPGKNLLPNKTYYWRVRSNGKPNGPSVFSTVGSFVTP